MQKYPYTMLFVEDAKAARENYVRYLEMLFEKVYEAKDGIEAFEIYTLHKPDIMIIDINLPRLNGIDLLKKIRKNDLLTKVIMLTAHTDKSFLLEVEPLQLTKYLVKPVNRKNLKETLQLAINELEEDLNSNRELCGEKQ